jgi:hypothetical protein
MFKMMLMIDFMLVKKINAVHTYWGGDETAAARHESSIKVPNLNK